MNIQIYGTKKSNDTKKADRFFKERAIKFQFVDLSANKMSPGELRSILNSLKLRLDDIVDYDSKFIDSTYYKYLASDEAKLEKVIENQSMLKQPIVRNGKRATLGLCVEEWKKWIEEEKNGH